MRNLKNRIPAIPNEFRTPVFVFLIMVATWFLCMGNMDGFPELRALYSITWGLSMGYFGIASGKYIEFAHLNQRKELWDIHLTEFGDNK